MTMIAIAFIVTISTVAICISDDSEASVSFTYDDINYETTSDTEVAVIAGNNQNQVIIPSYVEHSGKSYRVSSIGDKAFYRQELFSVTIPATVLYIGEGAFFGCVNLVYIYVEDGNPNYNSIDGVLFNKDVLVQYPQCNVTSSYTIPDNVRSIGKDAFNTATFINEIIIGKNVTSIHDGTFDNCKEMKKFIVSEDNEFFSSDSTGTLFDKNKTQLLCCPGNTDIVNYTVPSTVTAVHDHAFYHCTPIKSIYIGSSVKSIGKEAIYDLARLSSITVDPENTNYCSDNNVLFNKNKTELIKYPAITSDNVYNIPNTVVTICDYSFDSTSLHNVVIPSSVVTIGNCSFYRSYLSSITIPDSVKTIGREAFNCAGITSIVIGSGVTSIGPDAFSSNTRLESINVDPNNTAFCSIDGVLFDKDAKTLIYYPSGKNNVSYTVPSSVTRIGESAVCNCVYLKTLIIPDNVISIDNKAFAGNKQLNTVTIGNGVISIGDSAFIRCNNLATITLGDHVQSIGDSAFYQNRCAQITIPDSVTSIGAMAFQDNRATSITVGSENQYYCSENGVLFNKDKTVLICYPAAKTDTSYVIPNTVRHIGESAFFKCTDLSSVMIPNGVISIGSNAFNQCEKLTGISIPASVTSIGSNAFSICDRISGFTVDAGNAEYCSLNGVLFDKEMTTLINYPAAKTDKEYVVPDTVKRIGERAFFRCANLSKVTIPDSVVYIDSYAFSYSSVTSMTVLGDLMYIGTDIFDNGFDLDTAVFYGNINHIGSNTFRNTNNVKVFMHGTEVPAIGWNALISGPSVYVPFDLMEEYSNKWSPYARYLKAAAEIPTANTLVYNGNEQTGVDPRSGGYTAASNTAKNVGTYTAVVTLENGVCWFDTTKDVKNIRWTISHRQVTVKADDVSKRHGNQDPVLSATVTGLIGKDMVDFTMIRSEGEDVGTYTIKPYGETIQGNYTVTYESGTFTVEEDLSNIASILWAIPAVLFVILLCTLLYSSVKKD